MAKMSATALLWFGLLLGLTARDVTPTTRMAPNSAQNVLGELHKMKEQLDSIQQAMHSGMACGSNLELITVKRVLALETDLEAMKTTLEATVTKLEATDTALQLARDPLRANRKGASTFVRWGRKTCGNTSDLVYTGIAGGSHYTHPGAAVNPVCLTMDPQTDSTAKQAQHSKLYGAEYEQFGKDPNHDVACSVCRASQSTTIMLPGTQACPAGWTTQYAGYLSAGYWNHAAASQYVCLDKHMENDDNGENNDAGKLFYYTHAVCGSLPCPPYKNNQVVLCSVCSK